MSPQIKQNRAELDGKTNCPDHILKCHSVIATQKQLKNFCNLENSITN